MQTHPSLVERSVGAILKAFSRGQVTLEEAELDLTELLATQMIGKTDYCVAVIGFYVRAVLKALASRQIDLPDAFDTFVDAAIAASGGTGRVSAQLAQPFARLRRGEDSGRRFAA